MTDQRMPPPGDLATAELDQALVACPTAPERTVVPRTDGACPGCGRPWTEHEAAA